MKSFKFILAVMFLFVSTGFAKSDSQQQYFAVFMDNHKIGYAVQNRQVDGTKVTTITAMDLTMGRGDISMHVSQKQTSFETTDGKPLGFESSSDMGAMGQTLKGKIDPNGKLILSNGQSMDWPKGAVMAEGLRLMEAATGLKEGSVINATIFDPETTTAIKTTTTIGTKEKIDLLGRVVMLTKAQTLMQVPTGAFTVTDYVDSNLISQKTIMPIMGMNLEMVACDKLFALSKNDVVDFLDKAAIQSPVSLAGAENAKAVKYTLVPINNAKLQFPKTDNQEVKIDQNGSVVLTARPVTAAAGGQFPYKGSDTEVLKALKPGRFVQSDNKEIIELSKKAVGNAKDPAEAAKRIETFVREYITEKNFSVGYASALEVIQGREGDCSEHAVLTAALCRAAGIPTQVVFGVLYVDEFGGKKNVFMGHAWNQAYIGGKWIQLDATCHAVGPTRIAMAAGSGDMDEFFGVISTFGNFKIVSAKVEN